MFIGSGYMIKINEKVKDIIYNGKNITVSSKIKLNIFIY